jgi:proline dehydrogenase
MNKKVDFRNTEIAFASKTNAELLKARFLFELLRNKRLVAIGNGFIRWALHIGLPIEWLIKATVFKHFCGGVTLESCKPLVTRLEVTGVSAILDYSVEGQNSESQFDQNAKLIQEEIRNASKSKNIAFAVFKPTSIGRLEVFESASTDPTFTSPEFEAIKRRYMAIGQTAAALNQPIMIDAEESWMQTSADALALDLMREFNINNVLIYNTFQMYLSDRLQKLKDCVKRAEEEGFKLGAKLVRGAYIEKERERARKLGYTSPICPTKEDTDALFDQAVAFVFENTEYAAVFVGTHNEQSTLKAANLALEKYTTLDHPNVWFGQLQGMSDQITYNMASAGARVAKLIPYGPVKEVLPYLIRRAEENTSITGQTGRELSLLRKEMSRRKHQTTAQSK